MEEEKASEQTFEVIYLDGHKEICNWVARAGRAKVKYGNGDSFDGRFDANRLKHGKGIYRWASKEDNKAAACFDGEFVQGKKTGFGCMKFRDGSVYEGIWQNNVRNGNGMLTFSNGDVFSGTFSNDKPHGAGSYKFKQDGSMFIGEWMDGDFLRGSWVRENGGEFFGQFGDGQPKGRGIFRPGNGLQLEVDYKVEKKEEGEEGENIPLSRTFVKGKISTRSAVLLPHDSEEFVLKIASTRPSKRGSTSLSASSLEEEKTAIEILFDSVDKNRDESIAFDELVEALDEASKEVSILKESVPLICSSEISRVLKDVDTDKNGTLSLREFHDFFYVVKLFGLIDVDGSGSVRHSELQQALETYSHLFPEELLQISDGNPCSRMAVSRLISAVDSDDDRLLTFPEFLHLILAIPEEQKQT